MEVYQEILNSLLADKKVQITFPGLNVDVQSLIENKCYQILCHIRTILSDNSLDDRECFMKIEQIVCALEDAGISAGSRHDFG